MPYLKRVLPIGLRFGPTWREVVPHLDKVLLKGFRFGPTWRGLVTTGKGFCLQV